MSNISAYGEAAALALEVCMEPMPQLCALVAYYPSSLPNDGASLPPSINCIIHLAGTQDFAGSRNCYGYTQSDIGFAERNSGRYDSVSDNLAWSRTMACLREGFDIVSNPGPVWETHMMMKYGAKDLQGTMRTVTDDACVNNVPVMTGGSIFLCGALPLPMLNPSPVTHVVQELDLRKYVASGPISSYQKTRPP